MKEILYVINPISFLGILVLIGYIVEKCKFVSSLSEKLSKLILHITLPLLVIVSISEQSLQDSSLNEIFLVVLMGILAIGILLSVNFLIGKLLKIKKERQTIHSLLGAFGNVIFLGYPFIYMLFGEVGLFYAILYSMVNDLILWTLGVYFLRVGSGEWGVGSGELGVGSSTPHSPLPAPNSQLPTQRARGPIHDLLNPNTISFFIGLTLLILNLHLPVFIKAPLKSLGSTTTPLSMLFIGSILAKISIKNSLKNATIWSICCIKMIFVPIIFLFIFKLFLPIIENVNIILYSVIILQIAMPTQVILSVLADRYNADPEYAAQAVFITTLISSITLPFIYFLCITYI